jgi:iron(III) transport system permease protein
VRAVRLSARVCLLVSLFALVLAPLFALLGALGSGLGAETGPAIAALGFEGIARASFGSLRLSLLASVVAVVFGGLAALVVEGTGLYGRGLFRGLALLPLALPPYLLALASIELLGPRSDGGVLGTGVYGWPFCALLLGAVNQPLVFIAVAARLRRVEVARLEAAWLSGGRRAQLLQLGRLLWPSLALGGALVFAASLVAFAAPELLRTEVLTRLVYARFDGFRDLAGALGAAAPLMLFAALVTWPAARLLSEGQGRAPGRGVGLRPLLGSPFTCLAATAAAAVLVLPVLLLPAYALLQASLSAPEAQFGGVWSLARQALDGASGELLTSLGVGLVAGALAALAAALLVVADWRPRGAWSFAALLGLIAVPGPLVGIGLVITWSAAPAWLAGVYDSTWMLVIAQLARGLPMALLLSALLFGSHPRAADEAALLAGRSPLALAGRWRDLVLVGVLIYARSAGEYAASSLVAPPGAAPLSVKLLNLVHFGRSGELSVLSLSLVLTILIPSGVLLGVALGGGVRRSRCPE